MSTETGEDGARAVSRRDLFRWAAPVEPAERTPAAPEIGPECTGCEACVRTCPVGALLAQRTVAGLRLDLEASACVGCGECARVCPERAVVLVPVPPGRGRSRLITVLGRVCAACGAGLGAGERDRCTPCATRSSLAADALGQLFG